MDRYPPLVDAVRAIAFREVREDGAAFITEDWVSKKLFRSKLWVRKNWEKSYGEVYQGNIWPPGPHNLQYKADASPAEQATTKEHLQRQQYLKCRPKSAPVRAISELPATDKPVAFIEEDGSGSFKVNDTARQILGSIDKPVCVIAIAGKYRTGKSFLMNRLYGRNSGFPLGGTIQSETKGIWMWQREHPSDPNKTLVLLDTEGLYDVEKGDSTHDMKLFTLAVLLSSVLVFNVQCTIDDAMIHQLHLVSKLTENVKTKKTRSEETGEAFSKYFPTFIMVVRDFFLELKINGEACTENQYLEHSLKLKPGRNQEIRNYNEPRTNIKEFFPKRHCFVLPKPLEDSEKLRNLDTVLEEELKLEFLQKADNAVIAILAQTGVFTVEGDTMTAQRFAELASVYVDTLNSGGVPCIESAVTMLREVECRKAREESLNIYISIMITTASSKMPLESAQLSQLHTNAMEEAIEIFQKRALFDEEGTMVKEFLDDVNTTYQDFVRQNEDESSYMCQSQLHLRFIEIDKKIESKYYTKEDGYNEYKEDCDFAVTMYLSYPDKGPMAQTILTKYLKGRENEGYTILNSDKALTEAAKQLRKEQAEREHQELMAQAQQERNEALRQQMEDEQENNKRMLKKVKDDMQKRLDEQERQQKQLVAQKQREYEELKKIGSEQAARLEQQLNNAKQEHENMKQNQQRVATELQDHQQQNDRLLQEIKNLKDTDANQQQRLQQLQQQVNAQQQGGGGGGKKRCIVM